MTNYLIIGSGRTARHFSNYFQLLGLHFKIWGRHESWERLQECLEEASHVLVLIADSSIETFYLENLKHLDRTFVQFSGALEVKGMDSTHPLMTFSQELYDLESYKSIPFITTSGKTFSEILPGLPNRSFRIEPEQKALYHALCVASGNFTTLLWQKMAEGMKNLNLPADVHFPYMQRIFKNLISDTSTALTGPLARKDLKTVLANDRALLSDPFQNIYRAFIQVYFPEASKHLQAGEK